jgi:ferrous iron transport protein A
MIITIKKSIPEANFSYYSNNNYQKYNNFRYTQGVKGMDLSQINTHQKVLIKAINAQNVLKKRLLSLGFGVGKTVEVVETSLQKNTIKLALGFSSVALRFEEAKLIEVEVLS